MTEGGRKRALIAGAVVLLLVVVCVWIGPAFIRVDRYRPEVEAYLEQKTGKPAHIGRLKLTIFPHLAIEADNFIMSNPMGFPMGEFLKARRIYAVLNLGALWHRRVVIQSLIIDDPEIHLLSAPGGQWNYQNPPSREDPATSASQPARHGFTLGSISKINVDGGVATIANLLPSGDTGYPYFEAHGISCRFRDVNLRAARSLESASAQAGESMLRGLIGFPAVAYAAENASQPQPIAHGSFKADTLRFGAVQASSAKSRVWVFPKQTYLDKLTLRLAGGTVKSKADLDFSGQNFAYKIRTIFNQIDVAQLAQAFPNIQGKITGTLQGDLNFQGEAVHTDDPLAGLEGTGQVSIRNGKLPSLQLNRNLLALARIAGLGSSAGDPAAFSLISSDLNIAKQVLTSHNIKIVSNDLDVDGSGTLRLAGSNAINYTGLAKVPARKTGLTKLLAAVSSATFSNGKLTFPFDLRGTVDHPKFSLKGGKGGLFSTPPTAKSGKSKPSNLIQGITKLLRKKKSSPPQ